MRALKWSLAVALALALLLGGGVLVLAALLDPNAHRERMVAAVEEATGRSFSLGGEIGWSLFPTPGLSAGPVALGNDPSFAGPDFLQAQRVSAALELLPLLRRRIEVREIALQGVRLSLVVAPDGRDNWSSLALALAAPAPGRVPSPEPTLSVDALVLHDATLHYGDQQAGVAAALTGLDLSLGPLRPGTTARLACSGAFVFREWRGAFDLAAALEDLMAGAAPRATVERLAAEAAGSVPLRLALEQPLTFDLATGVLSVPGLRLESGTARARLGLDARGLPAAPVGEGWLEILPFAPGPWLRRAGFGQLAAGAPESLTRLEGRAAFGFDGDGLAVGDLDLELDDSRLAGRLSLNDALRFDLRIDAVDLDRYLPAGVAPAPRASSWSPELPVAAVDGTLEIGRLELGELEAKALVLAVRGDRAGLRIAPGVPLPGAPGGDRGGEQRLGKPAAWVIH